VITYILVYILALQYDINTYKAYADTIFHF